MVWNEPLKNIVYDIIYPILIGIKLNATGQSFFYEVLCFTKH